jgi:hypothetical protein
LTSAHRAQIPGLLRDDLDACSLTDQSIYDLSDIESPGGTAGNRVGDALNTATVWTTSDALGVIATIQALTNGPNGKARAQLLKYEGQPPSPEPVNVADARPGASVGTGGFATDAARHAPAGAVRHRGPRPRAARRPDS